MKTDRGGVVGRLCRVRVGPCGIRALLLTAVMSIAAVTKVHADCEGLKGSDFTRCKNAQGQREIGGWRNPAPIYTPSTPEPTPTYRPPPTPQPLPRQSVSTEPAEPISISQDRRLLSLPTMGRTVSLPPMGIKDWYTSGWWPDGKMRPLVLRVEQGVHKYELGILIDKTGCEAARQRAAAWVQRMSEQDRARVNYRTFENRNFDPRWFREYSAWLDQRTTETGLCMDAPGGALVMKVRVFETDTFDPEAIRALTKNLADGLLPSTSPAEARAPAPATAATANTSSWELLYDSAGDKARMFVDRSTASRHGDMASIMALRETAEVSARFKVDALCNEGKWRVAYAEFFVPPMAQGRLLKRDPTVNPWDDAKGGSAQLLRAACAS